MDETPLNTRVYEKETVMKSSFGKFGLFHIRISQK
jgi:hypothetical protein